MRIHRYGLDSTPKKYVKTSHGQPEEHIQMAARAVVSPQAGCSQETVKQQLLLLQTLQAQTLHFSLTTLSEEEAQLLNFKNLTASRNLKVQF